MAMKQPRPGIVCHEGHDEPAPGGEHGAVAAGGVGADQLGLVGGRVIGPEGVSRCYGVGEGG